MVLAPERAPETPQAVSEPPDPYEGWQGWCEPLDYDLPCKGAEGCAGVSHPARRPLKCLHPWWAKNEDTLVCAPGYHRKEREWHLARLREVIRQQYFGETEHCTDDGTPLWKQHWRCQQASAKGDKLAMFLWVAYARETTGRYWKRHRLEADTKANRTSWFKQGHVYGWDITVEKTGAVGQVPMWDAEAGRPLNEHYTERRRWHFGLGPMGQNAALWVQWWDVEAPPEVLCREVEPFEAYLRKAEEVLVKLKQGIRCGDSVYHEKEPTWATLHRAVNMGSICPPNTKRHHKGLARFRKDARKQGLDPEEVVTRAMLGSRIPVEGQNERVAEIYAVLERKLPTIPH